MMKCKTKWRKCCCVNLFSISGSRHHSFTHLHCGSDLLMDICLKWKQEVFIHHAAVMASAGPWCLLHGCISVIYELTNCFCPDVFLWSDHLLSAKVISCAFFFFFCLENPSRREWNVWLILLGMLFFIIELSPRSTEGLLGIVANSWEWSSRLLLSGWFSVTFVPQSCYAV